MLTLHARACAATVVAGLWLLGGPVASGPASAATPDPEIAGYVAVDGGRAWDRVNGTRHFAEGKLRASLANLEQR